VTVRGLSQGQQLSTTLSYGALAVLFLNILIRCLLLQRTAFMHLFFRFSTSFSPSNTSNHSGNVLSISFLCNKKRVGMCACVQHRSQHLCLHTLCRDNSPCASNQSFVWECV